MEGEASQNKESFKAELVALHRALGNFQLFIARRSVPPRFEGEEYEAINTVLEMIENETNALR